MIESAMQTAVSLLRKTEQASLEQLRQKAGVSVATMKRGLQLLRQRFPSAELSYSARDRAWRLGNQQFELALSHPNINHLLALTAARDVMQQLNLPVLAQSVRGLLSQLSATFSARNGGAALHPEALHVAQQTTVVPETRYVLDIIRQVRRGVIQIEYYSPWEDRTKRYTLEPWQVALINGVFYVKGWSRSGGPREFRMATIHRVLVKSDMKPAAQVPPVIWPDELGWGVDDDRPGEAELVFEGPVARWLKFTRWHSTQVDAAGTPSSVLHRRMRYRSCRELARFLAQYADGLRSIAPADLREELAAHLNKGSRNIDASRSAVATTTCATPASPSASASAPTSPGWLALR